MRDQPHLIPLRTVLESHGNVVISREALKALFRLYDLMENQIATYDPGDVLVSYSWCGDPAHEAGVELTGIAELVSTEDSWLIEQAVTGISEYIEEIGDALDEHRRGDRGDRGNPDRRSCDDPDDPCPCRDAG